MTQHFAVILAAGKGTRMKSDLAKVLHPIGGRPLLQFVLDACEPLHLDETVVIVGHQAEQVSELSSANGASTALQAEQLGTGHAVDQARARLAGRAGQVLVLCGDVPLLTTETIRSLLERTEETGSAATVLTAIADDATGYGRIVRDGDGRVTAIVEHKDASESQREIREYNTGTWCFDNAKLWGLLDRLDTDNSQGEYYLTDVVELLVADGQRVEAVICEDEREVQGINTVADLDRATTDWQEMGGAG
jgi:bifunctional UDP-N-acetylglucosamine pyrophosphorylase/glucosamine-1-phosphate N-acetyltransferase